MFPIVPRPCVPDIVADHVPNFLGTMLMIQEILSECCGGDLGDVLVLLSASTWFWPKSNGGNVDTQHDAGR